MKGKQLSFISSPLSVARVRIGGGLFTVVLQCTVPNVQSLYLIRDLWEVVFISHEGQVKRGRWLLFFFFFLAAQSIWLAFKAGGHKCHTWSLLGVLINKSSTTAQAVHAQRLRCEFCSYLQCKSPLV